VTPTEELEVINPDLKNTQMHSCLMIKQKVKDMDASVEANPEAGMNRKER
jgi:hypothetical protein